jgi:hypothetical protein
MRQGVADILWWRTTTGLKGYVVAGAVAMETADLAFLALRATSFANFHRTPPGRDKQQCVDLFEDVAAVFLSNVAPQFFDGLANVFHLAASRPS